MNSQSSRYDKLESLLQSGSSERHNLPLKYLRNITNNFSDERRIGEGGFGTVYKGELQNGETIAVKKFNSSMPGVNDKQFENEASHLMRLKHPNVVLLLSWCSEEENTYVEYNGEYVCAVKPQRLLCLEYMPKGNLRGYLSDELSGLGWDTRYKIIEGICYGLRYLHEEWQLNAPIVHMDLKPANILLDNNMVPKIADFGLSRLFSEEKSWTCATSCNGTLGYMSPEYVKKGLISIKSDIFSLGVIIIEIVTGRRDYPDETGPSSEEFIETVLERWSYRNMVENLVVDDVQLKFDYQQIRRCIQIGLDCVETDRFKRPTINEIIKTLHGLESEDSSNIKLARPTELVVTHEREHLEEHPAFQAESPLLSDTSLHPPFQAESPLFSDTSLFKDLTVIKSICALEEEVLPPSQNNQSFLVWASSILRTDPEHTKQQQGFVYMGEHPEEHAARVTGGARGGLAGAVAPPKNESLAPRVVVDDRFWDSEQFFIDRPGFPEAEVCASEIRRDTEGGSNEDMQFYFFI